MSEPEQDPNKSPFNFWRLVARVSSLGWSLALPIVGGALLGQGAAEELEPAEGRGLELPLRDLSLGRANEVVVCRMGLEQDPEAAIGRRHSLGLLYLSKGQAAGRFWQRGQRDLRLARDYPGRRSGPILLLLQ